MSEPVNINEFSPWAHPKAQAWFEMVFERSGLIEMLVGAVESKQDPLTMPQQRLVACLCMLLGRPGIWPSNQNAAFQKIVLALLRNRRMGTGDGGRPVTMTEHRSRLAFQENYEIELESLRRRVGLSKKINRLDKPRAWERFWY